MLAQRQRWWLQTATPKETKGKKKKPKTDGH
jgi:hypothetical protein